MVIVSSLCCMDQSPAARPLYRTAVTAMRGAGEDVRYHLGHHRYNAHSLRGIGVVDFRIQAAFRTTQSRAAGYRPTYSGHGRSSRSDGAPVRSCRCGVPRCRVRASDGVERNISCVSDPCGHLVDAQRRVGVLVRGHLHIGHPAPQGSGMKAQPWQAAPDSADRTPIGVSPHSRNHGHPVAVVQTSHTRTTTRPLTNSTHTTVRHPERNEHR